MLVLDMVDALKYERRDEANVVEVRIHSAEPAGSAASAASAES